MALFEILFLKLCFTFLFRVKRSYRVRQGRYRSEPYTVLVVCRNAAAPVRLDEWVHPSSVRDTLPCGHDTD